LKQSNALIVGVSGIRGILGAGMNPEIAVRFSAAFASRLREGLVVVGRDTRPSGRFLIRAVSSALQFGGLSVVDLGISSTPTVELMVQELGASGGVIISASHNGPEWNALKFLNSGGEFLSAQEMEELRGLADSGEPLFSEPVEFGALSEDATGDAVHIRRILELPLIDRERIADARFRAVVDCVNGAGSRIVPALLKSVGVTVVELFTDTGGAFPHDPEPRPENLIELSEAVKNEKADIGFACDPDADRLVLVDEEGTVCTEELTLAITADFILSREKGPLVANMSTSRLIDDVGSKHHVPVHRSKVGEAHVIGLMKETGAVIGGEGNGGVIYPSLHYGRDAMVGMVLVLQALAEEGVTLKTRVSSLPEYHIVKEKIASDTDLTGIEERFKNHFRGSSNTLDGIRIDMDNGWIHLRSSNTEPVVRIIAEARSLDEARRYIDDAYKMLKTCDETAL